MPTKQYKITYRKGEEVHDMHLAALNRHDAKRRFMALNLGDLIKVNKAVKIPDLLNDKEYYW
ncbi:hypothetical protein GCM10028803_51160 [Larkinella knui]